MSQVSGTRARGVSLVVLSILWIVAPPILGDGHWINDGSDSPPRLSVEQAIWAMGKLPRGGEEWSREEQVAKISGDGFDGFMVFLPRGDEAQAAYRDLASKHRLQITLQCAPSTVDDLRLALKAVNQMNARGLVAMIRPTFVTFQEGARKIRDMMAASREAKVPFYVETHRGTITQELLLTGRWAREIAGIQIHADLSHFVISYGIGGPPSGPIKAVFDAVLARTGMIDGRVGNGQQVQIDVGPGGDNPHARLFASWWKQSMATWLEQAKPGDVFVFKSELGPPAYSIVGLDGAEISDRWSQALVLRDLGIRTWNVAVRETGKGQTYQPGAEAKLVAKASTPVSARSRVERPKDWGKWPAKLEPTASKVRTLRGISHKLGTFYLAGQPAQPDLATAREEGVKTVINVRLNRELFGLSFDEQFACEDLSLEYIHMPIGPDTFDDAQAEKFLSAIRKAKKPLLLHGSNGNRVWGHWALNMGTEYGVSVDTTAAKALKLGVKKLVIDKFVRDYLARKGPK